MLSQMLCLIFMLGYLWRKRLFEFHITAFRARWIGSLFAKGIPAAFQQSIPAVSTSFLTSLVSGGGVSAIAAYGITGKMETILFYPAMVLYYLLIRMPLAAIFSALGLGLNGIWTAVLISHIVAAVAAALVGNRELGRVAVQTKSE